MAGPTPDPWLLVRHQEAMKLLKTLDEEDRILLLSAVVWPGEEQRRLEGEVDSACAVAG